MNRRIFRISSTLSLLAFGMSLFMGCASEQAASEEKSMLAIAPNDDNLSLVEGFDVVVVADSVGRARHLTVKENGDIYVHIGNKTKEGNSIIALRDTSGDGMADITSSFGPFPGTGIEIHKEHLYFATKSRIFRTKLDKALVPTMELDTIALLEGADGGHSEKSFAFDQSGNMYVNVGSLSNACMVEKRTKGSPGISPCTELESRGGIWKFSDDQQMQKQTLEKRYATGIRNAVAINWDPISNSLYVMQHGRDDLHRFWPDIYTPEQNAEVPAEELLHVQEGDNFGWPYCYYDPISKQRYLNPEYGGDGNSTAGCEDAKDPVFGFPAHWAPNDILFYSGKQFPAKYRGGAFIAFHGSWNRLGQKQDGFKVVFIPLKDGVPTGEYEIFADGFIGASSVDAPGEAKHRPCGLALGPDGSLYISDSVKGKIWRIVYTQGT